MAETILHFFMFFGALFAFVISLGQFVQKSKEPVHMVYSFSFAGLGLWLFHISLYSTGILDHVEGIYHLKTLPVPIIFLVPPLMVLRYKWIISNRFIFRRRYLLLFLPSLLSVLLLAAPLAVDGLVPDDRHVDFRPILSSSFASLPPYFRLVYASFMLPKLYLVVAMLPTLVSMATIWRPQTPGRAVRLSRMGYLFALSIVSSNMLAIAGDFASNGLLKIAVLMANVFTCLVYLATQRHPDYMRLLKIESRKSHYERSRLHGLDLERILARLREIMEVEKAFADEELSLKDLAGDLGISPHQLSQILNERIRKNFSTFVNEYRIDEAKKLLVEEPDRSILSVGIAAGFNSNTTFITAFSKHVGVSPGQYRKHNLNSSGGESV
ncbi:MAG: AraC family transcriptional regulator [Spirochaetes bacterium]|jgi:AraC-like DNA-binding protein|nr:AraC family transcriptional regulator [Spirochaetota bacterium]